MSVKTLGKPIEVFGYQIPRVEMTTGEIESAFNLMAEYGDLKKVPQFTLLLHMVAAAVTYRCEIPLSVDDLRKHPSSEFMEAVNVLPMLLEDFANAQKGGSKPRGQSEKGKAKQNLPTG